MTEIKLEDIRVGDVVRIKLDARFPGGKPYLYEGEVYERSAYGNRDNWCGGLRLTGSWESWRDRILKIHLLSRPVPAEPTHPVVDKDGNLWIPAAPYGETRWFKNGGGGEGVWGMTWLSLWLDADGKLYGVGKGDGVK